MRIIVTPNGRDYTRSGSSILINIKITYLKISIFTRNFFLLLVTFSTGVNSVGNRTRVIYHASMVRDKRINEKEERRKNCEIEM